MTSQHNLDLVLSAINEMHRTAQAVEPFLKDVQAAIQHLDAVREQLQPTIALYSRNAKLAAKMHKDFAPKAEQVTKLLSALLLIENDLPRLKDLPSLPPLPPYPKEEKDNQLSERDEIIELFRLRMFLLDLLDDVDDWPQDDWHWPYFEPN